MAKRFWLVASLLLLCGSITVGQGPGPATSADADDSEAAATGLDERAEPIAEPAIAAQEPQFRRLGLVVALGEDGTLRGTTSKIDPRSFKLVRVPNVTISFAKMVNGGAQTGVQAGAQFERSQPVVAEATSDSKGQFTVRLPANEGYTVVARAAQESAVLNLYVLSDSAAAAMDERDATEGDVASKRVPVRFASQATGGGVAESFDIVLIPDQQNDQPVAGPIPVEGIPVEGGIPVQGGFPGGGGGGFGGGGGGGFGGGGGLGLGGALGIGGLVAGVVALADNNNNASPFVP